MPVMPYLLVQPHGLAQHQMINGYSLPMSEYWPGVYRLDEGALNCHVPAAGSSNNGQVIQYDGVQLLPDLNLEPPL
uniref:Uncharacterized protein n=1 Tax=Chenopodium quinoa TaxID=63459 RepID=A0A803KS98_CHEQI